VTLNNAGPELKDPLIQQIAEMVMAAHKVDIIINHEIVRTDSHDRMSVSYTQGKGVTILLNLDGGA
jgi:hypothetical protein